MTGHERLNKQGPPGGMEIFLYGALAECAGRLSCYG